MEDRLMEARSLRVGSLLRTSLGVLLLPLEQLTFDELTHGQHVLSCCLVGRSSTELILNTEER